MTGPRNTIALPERSLKEFGVDAVCVGHGEEAALDLARVIRRSGVLQFLSLTARVVTRGRR